MQAKRRLVVASIDFAEEVLSSYCIHAATCTCKRDGVLFEDARLHGEGEDYVQDVIVQVIERL